MNPTPSPSKTELEHLSHQYERDNLTRAEYREALKSLYARETDVRELPKIRVQFLRVSIPTMTAS